MAKRKKIITAGPLVQEIIYPIGKRSDPPVIRAAKQKASSEAQRRANAKTSWKKLKLLLAANIVKGDIVGCLTFDDAHLPEKREQVRRAVGTFRHRLAAIRARRGKELVMFWSIESLSEGGRWHIHFVMNATGGRDYAEILAAWGRGSIDLNPFRCDKEKNYETLAKYMAKEAREKVGLHAWGYTRNAKRPEVESFIVPDNTELAVPKDAVCFADEGDRLTGWWFVEYAYHGALAVRKRRPRRRR